MSLPIQQQSKQQKEENINTPKKKQENLQEIDSKVKDNTSSIVNKNNNQKEEEKSYDSVDLSKYTTKFTKEQINEFAKFFSIFSKQQEQLKNPENELFTNKDITITINDATMLLRSLIGIYIDHESELIDILHNTLNISLINDNEINFEMFIKLLEYYYLPNLGNDKNILREYIFDLMDYTKGGKISPNELLVFYKTKLGDSLLEMQVKEILESFTSKGYITREDLNK
ncbi:hypothetical protein ABK040_003212 [Willaertia magna]